LNTFYDIPIIKVKMLVADDQFLANERWMPREFHVNNMIQFLDAMIRQAKSIDNLHTLISDAAVAAHTLGRTHLWHI
jgi:hypothetical protein